jgi:putative membrane protein
MSEADCTAAFQRADTNNDGTLSETEASSYMAALRVANKTTASGTMTKADFMQHCQAGAFESTSRPIDPGAPLAGANSFTESQAKDRVLAAGLSNVSALTKDDKGIWRGTATRGNQNVSVAVDYRGNVVSN